MAAAVGAQSARGPALAGWVAAVASPCTLIPGVKGCPPPAVVRKWRIEDGLSNNHFLFETQKRFWPLQHLCSCA